MLFNILVIRFAFRPEKAFAILADSTDANVCTSHVRRKINFLDNRVFDLIVQADRKRYGLDGFRKPLFQGPADPTISFCTHKGRAILILYVNIIAIHLVPFSP